jgi:hypothetical protein
MHDAECPKIRLSQNAVCDCDSLVARKQRLIEDNYADANLREWDKFNVWFAERDRH